MKTHDERRSIAGLGMSLYVSLPAALSFALIIQRSFPPLCRISIIPIVDLITYHAVQWNGLYFMYEMKH